MSRQSDAREDPALSGRTAKLPRHETDRIERVSRRLARRSLCTHRVASRGLYDGTGWFFCAAPAHDGELCREHFTEAFSLGLVLH